MNLEMMMKIYAKNLKDYSLCRQSKGQKKENESIPFNYFNY